jgi:hypothetical protein
MMWSTCFIYFLFGMLILTILSIVKWEKRKRRKKKEKNNHIEMKEVLILFVFYVDADIGVYFSLNPFCVPYTVVRVVSK